MNELKKIVNYNIHPLNSLEYKNNCNKKLKKN